MQLRFRTEPCSLCGNVHPLDIHSYVPRSYRDPERGEDVWIEIPVFSCAKAKSKGLQYTKRLLPDFLIPYARMRLDKVVEAGRDKEGGSSLEKCCRILGCLDLRTARMHLKRLEVVVKTVALALAEKQAAAVHLHEHNTHHLRPQTPLDRLDELYRQEEQAKLRSGGERGQPGGLKWLLQAELWKSERNLLMSYVCRPPPLS